MSDRDAPDHEATDHERWEELAAGHALHALEPAESVEFEQHRATCDRCQTGLDEMSFVAAQLGALAGAGGADAPPWRRMRAGVVGGAPAASKGSTARRRWLLPAATAAVVVAAAAVLTVRLTGGGAAPALTAAGCARDAACHQVVLRSADGLDVATVLVRGLTATVASVALGPAPAGKEWALWQVPYRGRPMLVRTFRALPATVDSLPTSFDPSAAFALSAEPAGTRPDRPSDVLGTS
jgi:hypothetical protein